MEKIAPAQEDPHVDAISPRLEEHEIARVQAVAPDALALLELFPCRPGQIDAVDAVDLSREGRTVDPPHGVPAELVGHALVGFHHLHEKVPFPRILPSRKRDGGNRRGTLPALSQGGQLTGLDGPGLFEIILILIGSCGGFCQGKPLSRFQLR